MGNAGPRYRVVPFLALGLVTLVISGFQRADSWAASAWEKPDCETISPAFGIIPLDESRLGPRPIQEVASPPVLGQTPEQVEEAWGPGGVYDTQPPIHIYCLGGMYIPYTYDHDGGWWVHPPSPLKPDTFGPCGCDRPGNLFARYEANKLAVAGYFASHGSTYDSGWIAYLDRMIAGVDPYSNEYTRLEGYSSEYSDPWPHILAVLRFPNGSTMVSVEVRSGFHAFLTYAPGVLIDPRKEPLLSKLPDFSGAIPKGAPP